MKLSKGIWLCIVIVLTSVNSNASRIKQDLLSPKEDEIIILLKKKIVVLDKLIVEAKIYQDEKDPLIQKDFFNLPNGFATKAYSRQKAIGTNTDSSLLVPKKKSSRLGGSNKIGGLSRHKSFVERDILNIKMRKKSENKISFHHRVNYRYVLDYKLIPVLRQERMFKYKKKIKQILDDVYVNKFESLSSELLNKYLELITILSANEFNTKLRMILENRVKEWSIGSLMTEFEFSLKEDELLQKKTYDLSMILNEHFESLHKKESISLTGIPSYYDKTIDKNLRCLETSTVIQYKGRICINPIDVDTDIYFKYGILETRENNFLQKNKVSFNALMALDQELFKASEAYIKFALVKVSTPTIKTEINLEGGL